MRLHPAAMVTRFLAAGTCLAALAAPVHATTLTISPAAHTRPAVVAQADALVRRVAKAFAAFTEQDRYARSLAGRYDPNIQLSLPSVVRLSGEKPGGGGQGGNRFKTLQTGGELTLQFDASGAEAFPAAYQQLLQSVFDDARPTLDLLFGHPAVAGTVHVANFDASIGDRQAVAGGYYLPDNGSGAPEIRFPIYNANETAAVNFVHCLLLAYLGPDAYAWDGFEEGLVRAVTMKVCRTPSALPSGLDAGAIEGVLENTYDIRDGYDWSNQRALGGPRFLAPNLVNVKLPLSGGGGPYLLRYIMAGSAWAKVLVEYPTFAASLNADLYANPALADDLPGLEAAGQTILAADRAGNPTVEGRSFPEWARRQCILSPTTVEGEKLLLQPTAIASGLIAGDFGVFILEGTYFSTDAAGDETLLGGTSYPIFWDDSFNRVETGAQDDQITFTASDGSVVPNFPDLYAGAPYRASVDMPVGDQSRRVYLPVGAVATFASGIVNDCYGTIEGVDVESGDALRVEVSANGVLLGSAGVFNDAFGFTLGTKGGYNGYATISVALIRTRDGSDQTVLTRTIDKTPGPLNVDLRAAGEATYTLDNGLPAGLSMLGFPVDPFTSDAAQLFGLPAASLLLARYDSTLANYDLYPAIEAPQLGHAYYLQTPAAQASFSIQGATAPGISSTVALKPGWNMIADPILEIIPTDSVRVVHASDFPDVYSDDLGTKIGTDFFTFVPGPADPVAGVPLAGSYVAASEFDPGVGYFFRVLAPEGVSLVFDPDGKLEQLRQPQPGWALRVAAAGPTTDVSALLAESPAGSDRYNPLADSELPPPLSGGFQVCSLKGLRLYRDTRPLYTRQTYTVRIEGVTPGVRTLVKFSMAAGRVRTFQVYDTTTGKNRTMAPGGSMWVVPATTSIELLVTVGGM